MGEKEGTAPSRTKKKQTKKNQLERTKKGKQQLTHESVVCL